VRRFFSRFAQPKQTPAEILFAAVVEASRQPALYEEYGVADTVDGRFEMLAMHLFACVHALTRGEESDPELARQTAEVFVQEMDATFRDIGISDKRIPRRVKALFSTYGGRLGAYGSALSGEGGTLEEAIRRNIFEEEADPALSARLAAYLRGVLDALEAAPVSAFREGRPPFPDPQSLLSAPVPPESSQEE